MWSTWLSIWRSQSRCSAESFSKPLVGVALLQRAVTLETKKDPAAADNRWVFLAGSHGRNNHSYGRRATISITTRASNSKLPAPSVVRAG